MQTNSGKSRAQRIELDYHRHRGWLYWSRWVFAGVAFVSACSYGLFVLAGALLPVKSTWLSSASQHVSTGPLASVHAHFESDCSQCHADSFPSPIAADAFKFSKTSSQATACQKCHSVSSHLPATFHQLSTSPTPCVVTDQNCSGCHLDHQGRNVDLARVMSQKCTQCHSDLAATCSPIEGDLRRSIGDFTVASHAQFDTQAKLGIPSSQYGGKTFRSLRLDPGRIKFDHSQHLRAGQVEAGQRGSFRFDMLSPRWQNAYGSVGSLVQLDCADCHQISTVAGTATSIELGHHYAPIDYEKHCIACHQLTFMGQTADMLPLPHAATRSEIEVLLAAKSEGGLVTGSIRTTNNQTEKHNTSARLNEAVNAVFQQCRTCHNEADIAEDAIVKRLSNLEDRPLIPQLWLKHGLFDHGAHEKITNCEYCHRVNELSAEISRMSKPGDEHWDNEVVMIKGPESCVPCHRDPRHRDPRHRDAGQRDSGGREPNVATDQGEVDSGIDLGDKATRQALLGIAAQPIIASDNCMLCHRYHWSRPAAARLVNGVDP